MGGVEKKRYPTFWLLRVIFIIQKGPKGGIATSEQSRFKIEACPIADTNTARTKIRGPPNIERQLEMSCSHIGVFINRSMSRSKSRSRSTSSLVLSSLIESSLV